MTDETLKLVDPQLRRFVETAPATTISAELLPAIRAGFGAALGLVEDPDALVAVTAETIAIPGRSGDPAVKAVLHRPARRANPCGAILHLHGGGFVTGDPYGQIPWHRKLAYDLGCVLLSVDYRLAPETRFPGAVHDGYAALAWLFANAASLGLDRRRIGIMGESAGGTLAAAIALMARDLGDHRLAFQHLTYPALDDRTCTSDEPNPYSGAFVWTRPSHRFAWEAWLGYPPGGDDVPAYAAPARARDLSNLPPTFLATGALDLFVDEDIAFAHRLIRSGVATEFHIYPGAYHGFQWVAPNADVTATADKDSVAALARFLKIPG